MKKSLAMALGALLVAGSAAPAAAASHIDFSGYYRAYFMNNINGDGQEYTDSYFGHRLQMDFVFTPTDEIQVFWSLDAPRFQRWGNGGNRIGGTTGPANSNLQTRYIYGVIKQDWGNVAIGKVNEDLDTYGLGSLGYMPSYAAAGGGTNVSPFDSGLNWDAIRYFTKLDNGFGIMAQYAKAGDGYVLGAYTDPPLDGSGDFTTMGRGSDISADRYQLEGTYQWDGGGAALGVWYDRDAVSVVTGNPGDLVKAWYINPAVMQSWGDFSAHFEGMYGQATINPEVGTSTDAKGWGAYLDADYNYGPGNVTLSGWYVSGAGSKAGPNSDYNGLVDINDNVGGGNFYPLLVAYNGISSPMGGADRLGVTGGSLVGAANEMGGLGTNRGTNNHWAVMVGGKHAFTDDISMQYGLGYLSLVHANYQEGQTVTFANGATINDKTQDKELGYEADLGFTFQLLDNLSFSTAAGYLFAGDALAMPDPNTGKWDSKDSYVWYNSLTFSF
jgi:hypothetical protein